MAVRDIVILPDPGLKEMSRPVEDFGADFQVVVDDMLDTMYDAPGIGLAAVQIGLPIRVLVMDVSEKDAPRDPRVLVNPEITWASDELAEYEEGCLSIPDYFATIKRPSVVRVAFQDRHGEPRQEQFDGLGATCVQHEIDHLNGILFIDHISRLKRDRVIKKFVKLARHARESA